MTLCFLLEDKPARRVLLGRKKTGFGVGKYYGFGGKVEAGETITNAAVRETYEESGLRVNETDLVEMGQVYFVSVAYQRSNADPTRQQLQERQQIDRLGAKSVAYLFTTKIWWGEPYETDEMIPTWFDLQHVPYHQMWPTDKVWLRPVLAGRIVDAIVTTYANGERTAICI